MSKIAYFFFRMSDWQPYCLAASLIASDNLFQSDVIIQTSCKKNINDYRFDITVHASDQILQLIHRV